MWEALREWTLDNPFFRLEWKQWLRRAGPWQLLIGVPGNLCLLVLGFHVLYALASPFGKAFLNRPLSFTIFGALVVVHLMGWMGAGVPGFRLDEEAREERLAFIRLLPGDPRRVLLQIAAARSLLRAIVLFAPLPVYLTLGWYGSPPLADLVTLFLLLMFLLFGPVAPSEIVAALRTAEGWSAPGAETKTEEARAAASATASRPERAVGLRLLVILGMAVGLVLLLAAARAHPETFALFANGLTRVLNQFLERNYVLAFVLWIGEPRSFYQGALAPLWVVGTFLFVRGLVRVQETGSRWARGIELAPGPASPAPPEEPLVPAESVLPAVRTMLLYRMVAVPLALFLVLGFFWEAWVLRGRLAGWVGLSTPAGSLAALFTAAVALCLFFLFEELRCGRDDERQPFRKALRSTGQAMGEVLGVSLLFVLAAGLAGGVFPGRELLAVIPGLLCAAGALLVFGAGWRLFRHRWLLGAAGPLTVLVRGLVHGLFWIATYAGPLMVLGRDVSSQAHRWVSVSPVYLLLLQFAPLRSPHALPWLEAAATPALVGLGLGLLAVLRKQPEEDPEIGTRDPLLAALTRTAQEWDNPVFSMALRRRVLLREHLTARVLRMPLVILIMSGVGMSYFLLQGMLRSGRTLADTLETPSFISESLTTGALTGLSGAFTGLAFCALFSTAWSSAISGENAGSRHRQLKQDLRLSPLSDAEIMRGTLWGCLVEPLPALVAGPIVSLVWVLAAVAYGAGTYWLLVWPGAAATMLGIGWLSALDVFKTWSPKSYRSSLRSYLAVTGPGLLLVTLLGFPVLIRIPEAAPHLRYGLPLLALTSAAITFAQLPAAHREAEHHVRESRKDDTAA